jgi:hypothetical protein
MRPVCLDNREVGVVLAAVTLPEDREVVALESDPVVDGVGVVEDKRKRPLRTRIEPDLQVQRPLPAFVTGRAGERAGAIFRAYRPRETRSRERLALDDLLVVGLPTTLRCSPVTARTRLAAARSMNALSTRSA